MSAPLDLLHEESVALLGVVDHDLTVPAGEEWEIRLFGGSAPVAAEVQLWTSDGAWALRRTVNLPSASGEVSFSDAIVVPAGDGVRVRSKNTGGPLATISSWISGRRNEVAS